MKKLLFVLAMLFALRAQAQTTGTLTVATTTCIQANSCVVVNHGPVDATGNIVVTGGAPGTIVFEGSVGGSWAALYGTPWVGGAQVGSTTAAGGWAFNIAGKSAIRARMSVAGTANVSIYVTTASSGNSSTGGGSSGGTVDIAAGTNIIGKVAIDQTTDGTTNGVHLVAGTALAGKVGIDQTTDGTTNKVFVGNIATDVAIDDPSSGNPVFMGCVNETTNTTISASGDRTACHTTPDQRIQVYGIPGILKSGAVTSAMTGTTSTSVIGATASNYVYVTWCIVSNASTTVSTDILLQDGSGGTTLAVLPAPAAAVATTGGGGSMIPFPTPLKVTTAGNALYAANVTTGSSTKISCGGFISTVSY